MITHLVAGGVICGLVGGGLAAAANQLVERFPRSELLVWAALAGALAAVILVSIASMPLQID